MNKENCTKGGVVVDDRHIHTTTGYVYSSAIVDDDLIVEVNTDTRPNGLLTDTDKANLDLIAEAFNVLNETGYTPRDLLNLYTQMKTVVYRAYEATKSDSKWTHEQLHQYLYTHYIREDRTKYQPTNA